MPDTIHDNRFVYSLTVCAPAAVGEKLLDLLTEALDAPFEIGPMFTHGTGHGDMTNVELVSGRAEAVQAQLVIDEVQLEMLLARLREELRGAGVRYWATPVAMQGEIE